MQGKIAELRILRNLEEAHTKSHHIANDRDAALYVKDDEEPSESSRTMGPAPIPDITGINLNRAGEGATQIPGPTSKTARDEQSVTTLPPNALAPHASLGSPLASGTRQESHLQGEGIAPDRVNSSPAQAQSPKTVSHRSCN